MPGLNLTRAEAEERASILSPSRYEVALDLRSSDFFASTTTIHFSGEPGAETFVDFVPKQIHSITLNGNPLPEDAYADNRIQIGPLAADNQLVVVADCNYMHSGEGLHAFVDPEDGERYCYSQFEVADARRVFPTFEQPDLKAVFQFTVTTPEGWTVFSNSPTPDAQEIDGGLRYEFADTPALSTYVTAIVAGPYYGRTDTYRTSDDRELPLGVYCRQSLKQYLDADFIFDITKSGMAFFGEAYGMPYPFAKYDQIFVPEFNAGAMENVGCVTYRDQFIYRSKPTEEELEDLTNVILHELAHMWFGNLVTMQWWDDLWLNESFAEFMAHYGSTEATRFKDAWIGFLRRKEWGLKHDQMPSTHPIRAEIADLEDVEANFDGITYAKGAAVLRQLVSYVGQDNFLAGIHAYLTEHAYGNATLNDLLGALEEASGKDLRNWSKLWLEESGVTTLSPEIQLSDDGKIKRIEIRQSTDQDGVSLRPQRISVAGFDLEDGVVKRTFTQGVDVVGEYTEIPQLAKARMPDMLLVNDGDLGYAKVRLDANTLAFATQNVGLIKEPLTRRILLATAWDMTRDAEMSASEFVKMALAAAATETSAVTLVTLLAQIAAAASFYSAPSNRGELLAHAADRVWFFAKTAPSGSDQQKLLVESAATLASTSEQYQELEDLYTGRSPLFGLAMDPEMKWTLLLALVRGSRAGEADIAELLAADPSMSGQQRAAEARASINDEQVREQAWNDVMFNQELANDTRWAIADGFWAHDTAAPELYEKYVTKFFEEIAPAWDKHTFHIASRLVEVMFPGVLAGYLPSEDIPAQAERWLAEFADAPSSMRRLMVEANSEAERRIRAQRRDSEA